jgi:hypothetical protein
VLVVPLSKKLSWGIASWCSVHFIDLSKFVVLFSSVALAQFAVPVASAQEGEEPEHAPVLLLDAHRGADGSGAVIEAAVDPESSSVAFVRVLCRDGERVVGETQTTGTGSRVTLTIDGESATYNARCEADARLAPGEILAATRGVTIGAAAADDDEPPTWPFWVAGTTAVVALAVILIAVVVATASAPVSAGVPTVDGW